MKVLLVGVGGVGEAIAMIAKERAWVERLVLTDYNIDRAGEVQRRLGDPKRFPVERVDASDQQMIASLARTYKVDLVMNAVDPIFNAQIFDAAFEVGAMYMDMAMTLSTPHPTQPFSQAGVKLGDYQFERAQAWEKKGAGEMMRAICHTKATLSTPAINPASRVATSTCPRIRNATACV